jgi:hypothetical protein
MRAGSARALRFLLLLGSLFDPSLLEDWTLSTLRSRGSAVATRQSHADSGTGGDARCVCSPGAAPRPWPGPVTSCSRSVSLTSRSRNRLPHFLALRGGGTQRPRSVREGSGWAGVLRAAIGSIKSRLLRQGGARRIDAGVTRRLPTATHSSAAEKRPAEAAWDWREETKRARTREDPRRAEARRKAEQREEADERRFHEERRLAGPVSFRIAFGGACRWLPMTLATRLQD